jgi:translocation and assembly module TamB
VLGKRLDFDRGRLGFAGSVVPILDFAASTRSGSTTVTVLVTGPANQPRFNFTSSPQLPEDEVLAQLIFGRSLDDLSPLQIAQLAEAAGQLTGVVSGGGLVEQLRSATGVDDIDVRTDDETGETSIGVGKYLNDNTYLGLESGASAGSGKATIDLDIGRGIKLRGEADSSGETKGGIFFEREY